MSGEEVGIAEAVDAVGIRIRRSDLDLIAARNNGDLHAGLCKPLRCGGCTAPVTAVARHRWRSTERAPQFRLARDQHHDPGCVFDLDARLHELVTGHPTVVTKHAGGIIELRLGTASDLLEELEQARLRARRSPAASEQRRRKAVVVGVLIAPVITAARQLIQLMHDFDEDPLLAARFRVRAGDVNMLRWRDFCWPATSVADLVTDIDRHPRRMRAVFGVVRNVRDVEKSGSTSYCISLEHAAGVPVQIRTRDAELAHRARVGHQIVGVGMWSMYRPESVGRRRYEEAQLWPEIRAQVAIWTPR